MHLELTVTFLIQPLLLVDTKGPFPSQQDGLPTIKFAISERSLIEEVGLTPTHLPFLKP